MIIDQRTPIFCLILTTAVLALGACGNSVPSTGITLLGNDYNTTYRDHVIQNWQSRVSDEPRCASFKARFLRAGQAHESAATGAFVTDMMKVWKAAQDAGCEKKP